jgi:hypothetical protein
MVLMFIAALQSCTMAVVWAGVLSQKKYLSPAAMSGLFFLGHFINLHSTILMSRALTLAPLGGVVGVDYNVQIKENQDHLFFPRDLDLCLYRA